MPTIVSLFERMNTSEDEFARDGKKPHGLSLS
jgi:hypothetical protein